MRRVSALAALGLGVATFGTAARCAPEAPAEESLSEQPRATMDRIFNAIALLLPASLDEERFGAPDGRDATLATIDVLVRSAERLERHARGRDPGFGFLSRSLVKDVTQIRRRYALGRYREARFFLGHLTETCVACHSRLPSQTEFPLAERLLESVSTDALSPGERVRLEVATRQFDRALGTYERLFTDPTQLPARMDLAGHFVDYLTLCIRVRGELARPRPVLARVAARADTARYLRRNIGSWISALQELETERDAPPTLARARDLIARGERLSRFAADQEGLVYDLGASTILYRLVDAGDLADPELAEAFYLLGVADARARRSYWVSQAEFFFETAVRTAPHDPVAEKAYALLEEYTVLGYSGSAGVHVPHDVQETLDELRALMDAPE